ncbi:hypothetical protein MA9V1_050 [Chryseobacterium phage MA9V-1]|nr:hypothetical protein MA9V1_050 [Chryseobacterium phage MA9V-1]
MDLNFLINNTTLADIEANTELKAPFWKAPIYAVEYGIRKYLAKRVTKRYLNDIATFPELYDAFMVQQKTCMSKDETFMFISYEDRIAADVREQAGSQELMLLTDSYFAEAMQPLNTKYDALTSYILNTLAPSFCMVNRTKVTFIVLESPHLAHLMAILNHKWKIVLGCIFYFFATSVLFALIAFFITIFTTFS